MTRFETAAQPCAGLYMLLAPALPIKPQHRREVLRNGIRHLLTTWNCRSAPDKLTGRRICSRPNGSRAAAISVSYSGRLAIVFVGTDEAEVGVDIEICPERRISKFEQILSAVTDKSCENPMSCFVRAEAWSKAVGDGISARPYHYFQGSVGPGWRPDGQFISDIDLGGKLPREILLEARVAVSTCAKTAVSPKIRALKILGPEGQLDCSYN